MGKTKVVGVVRDAGVRKAGVDYPVGSIILSNGTANLPTGKIVKIATGEVIQTQDAWTPEPPSNVVYPKLEVIPCRVSES